MEKPKRINTKMKTKLTFALVACLTSTAFAEFKAPLPEFKNEKQLAEWRAEQASEATSQENAAEETAFYTGKPYLAFSGSYAFKYRSYNPEVARWTSEDPSGFPDGANSQIYITNPTSELDYSGLWHIKLTTGVGQSKEKSASSTLTGSTVRVEADLMPSDVSFSALSTAYAQGALVFWGSATAQITGNLSATSDGRVQLALSTTADSDSGYPALANMAVAYQYQNNQKEVHINITWGGANQLGGQIAFAGGGTTVAVSNNGGLAVQGGFNTLIYTVVE